MIGRFVGAISLSQGFSSAKKITYMLLAALAVFALIFALVDLSFSQIIMFLVFIAINLIFFFVGRSVPARTLFLFGLANVALILITIFSSGSLAMWTILSVGLFNSIMWSNIFTLSIHGLGKYTSQGSSLLVMAILGGALLPLVQGGLADAYGLQHSFFVPVFSYLYIAFFGFYCARKLGNVATASVAGGH